MSSKLPGRTPWKPPMGLLAMDIGGVVLLGLGLLLQFEPQTAEALSLPAQARVPLLVIGGALLTIGWAGLIRSLLAHRRS